MQEINDAARAVEALLVEGREYADLSPQGRFQSTSLLKKYVQKGLIVQDRLPDMKPAIKERHLAAVESISAVRSDMVLPLQQLEERFRSGSTTALTHWLSFPSGACGGEV